MKYILNYELYENVSFDGLNQRETNTVILDVSNKIKNILDITAEDIFFAGCAGKKANKDDITYNINLYIDAESVDVTDVYDILSNSLKYKTSYDGEKMKVIWPHEDGIKSIDVIIKVTDDFKWIKFIKYCPRMDRQESLYTGKHRYALLKAIAESIKRSVINQSNSSESVKEYSTYKLTDSGMYRVVKSFQGKNGILNKSYQVNNETRLITNDPDKFISIIFDSYYADNFDTFEDIKLAIGTENFKFKHKLKQIRRRFKKICTEFGINAPNF